jgi:protein-tyrosine-phosphatase
LIGEDRGITRFQILLVCRANVCRSPTAQLLLFRRLRANHLTELAQVLSAGTVAEPGQPWCDTAARWVTNGNDRSEMLKRHASRQLDRAMVQDADLVLTAARVERAAVVQLVPQATPRTFTLREAAALAAAVIEQLDGPKSQRAGPDPSAGAQFVVSPFPIDAMADERLRWLTSEMNSARGLVRMPQGRGLRMGRFPWRRMGNDRGLDIPDAHGIERVRHQPFLLLEAVDAWARAAEATIHHKREGS